ncbi:MAG TPA: UbiH/UbiF family hydroxylase [Burkholderiales bacterium]|nr:UbiH/UbiF family hydroxylase [Burkholderiales bacterium]
MSSAARFDVAVVGAGLVGASLAAALGRAGLGVALIEPSPPAAPAEAWDSRIYAISPASSDFLASVDAWGRLDAQRVQAVSRMEIFGDEPDATLEFSAYDAGVPTLAFIVESGRLAHALWESVARLPSVRRFAPARCERLELDSGAATLTLAGGEQLRASLVVGADGAQSWVRRAAGLTARASSYRQLGVVANCGTTRPHDATAFQWFRADGVLAYLPLPGNRISIVWSTPELPGRDLVGLAPGAFLRRVAEAGRGVLGDLTLITPPQAFPLQSLAAESMIGPRVALVGDAAHVVHPLAGQGVNLGFGDARVLAETLAAREPFRDCGDRVLTRRFERSRAEAVLAMRTVTDGLARLFGLPGAPAARVRNAGLNLTDRLAPVKNLLVRHAIG